jgi:hypothetical protein
VHAVPSATRGAAALLLAALLAAALPAQGADPRSRQARLAEHLFQRGKQLLDQGKLDEACSTLAESDQLDPSVGTLGLLALCHEKQGRLATAWAEYNETAERARAAKDDREGYARSRAAKIEPAIPRLTITVAERVVGLNVLRDRKPLTEDEIGVEARVNPGEIEVLAQAPGRKSWATTVVVAIGERQTVEVPPLEPTQGPRAETPSYGTGRLALAAVAGGVGLVGLGVMTGFGLSAASKNDESKDLEQSCTTAQACTRGRDLRDSAKTAATIATVGLGVGVAGLAAGAVLLFTAPGAGEAPASTHALHLRVVPEVGRSGAGVILRSTF